MDENEMKELRELVEFLKANGIAEFELERADMKVGLKFAGAATAAPAAAPVDMGRLAQLMASHGGGGGIPSPFASAAPPEPAASSAAAPATEADPHAGLHIVKSPIVGTFYDAPSPDSEPFVKLGDQVASGKVLCIVEAMKLMNEIESDAGGEVVKIFMKTGQPVEYGQALFAIKA